MKLSVTEREVTQTAELLKVLRTWESLKVVAGEYNRGVVRIGIDGNSGRALVEVSTDSHNLKERPGESVIDKCDREVKLLVGRRCAELAEEVCTLIQQHMPIPVER